MFAYLTTDETWPVRGAEEHMYRYVETVDNMESQGLSALGIFLYENPHQLRVCIAVLVLVKYGIYIPLILYNTTTRVSKTQDTLLTNL